MDETLYSFGIGFEDERFDESAYQDRLAGDLGLSLTRVMVGARDIAELLPRAIELSEKPTLRTAPAPLLRLSRAVREAGLKVVLDRRGRRRALRAATTSSARTRCATSGRASPSRRCARCSSLG